MTERQLYDQIYKYPAKVKSYRRRLEALHTEAQLLRAPEELILSAVLARWDEAVRGEG